MERLSRRQAIIYSLNSLSATGALIGAVKTMDAVIIRSQGPMIYLSEDSQFEMIRETSMANNRRITHYNDVLWTSRVACWFAAFTALVAKGLG